VKARHETPAARGEVAAYLSGSLARLVELAKGMGVDIQRIRVEVETDGGPFTAHVRVQEDA
jgi:hypothetical protein